ncbi:hypothetical protein E8E13_001221 [Curvularia kusanoi]|uniref:NADH:flavin oxidoreductase/NADH oxidase N-terminal domain-containing protein n=1 Tax=Curvularia kusanoi TaxID=90978 RepID=A0A9P4W3Q8_CURKU|nr:hypothetical protein E8E13_001221 [Curvularia kusanoi]
MGSMTRNRNTYPSNTPTPSATQYYTSRARDGAGLIVAEGTFICPTGSEWLHCPMMTSPLHAQAWAPIVSSVHSVGGTIYFQPWHEGRAQNDLAPALKETGYPVLAPSAVPAKAGKYRFLAGSPGHTANITAMSSAQILETVGQYRDSCSLARDAGFDGVEIIAQGGYLVHNFLSTRSNIRTDAYGGSVANRCAFLLEVVEAIATVYPVSHIGVKIAPCDNVADIACSYAELSETYAYLVRELVRRKIGFVNLSRRGCESGEANDDFSDATRRPEGMELPRGYDPLEEFGPLVKFEGSETKLMVNYGYTVEEAEALVQRGRVDLVSFGRPFICNPDLVERVRNRIPLASNDRGGSVNYGPYKSVDENYNDWPMAT